DIKAERDRLTAEVEKRDLLDKVSTSTGVPKNLIHGETEEQMMASAQALNTYIESLKPSYPQDKGGAKSAKPLTKEEILKIEDTEARMAAIAQHIELF
ncbi:MAG: hypothetical protein IJ125_05045, partial [Atopobiaceae bacterium]|nr:hypothetical protein [Atopobiaceae bacterium]